MTHCWAGRLIKSDGSFVSRTAFSWNFVYGTWYGSDARLRVRRLAKLHCKV